jgi:hypothetical protein
VTAKYHNLTAHTSINQSNFMGSTVSGGHVTAPAATHAFPLKAVLIVAAVAGAVAVAVVATHSGGSSNPGAVLVPGTPTVGP